jgi:hypothetical protein
LLDQSFAFGTSQNSGALRLRFSAVDHNVTGTISSYYGDEHGYTQSAGTTTTILGYSWVATTNAGTTGQSYGLSIQVGTAGGTLTDGRGIFIFLDRTSGTFTTGYGLFIGADSGITNLYGVAVDIGFKNGFGTTTPDWALDVRNINCATNTAQTLTSYEFQSTGTPAALFGQSHLYKLQSSTTTGRLAAQMDVCWHVATDSTRSAFWHFKTVHSRNTAGSGRFLLGPMKDLVDNTMTDLFKIEYAAADHTGGGGEIFLHFIAKQVSGSVQIQSYTRRIVFTTYHDGSTNTGVLLIDDDPNGAQQVATTGQFDNLQHQVNSGSAVDIATNILATSFDTATYKILVNSSLTTPSQITCFWNAIYHGEISIVPL